MNHAFSQAELDKLRTRPQGSKWFLAHHQPRTLAAMTLAATPRTHPVSAIEYAGSSGGLVDKDIELWIGNDNGSNLGKLRLRGTPTTNGLGASILPVAEAGSGLINWASATTIFAKEKYYPYPRHPRYNTSASQWRMDYSRVWPGSVIGPYANMGAPIVGFLENGSFTASFFNTNHLFWDAASLSVIWEFPNGSAVHSSGSSFTVTFTGASPNGSYIQCTVTDYSGASETAKRLIFVYDDETQTPHVNVGEIQGGIDSRGYRLAVEILDDGHDIQNDAEVIVFSKNIYNTTASQFGGNSPGRGNVLFHGFVLKETVQRKPFSATATMEAVTIDGILKETNSYDYFAAQKSSPTEDWVHEPALNLDRVAMRLLKERSTVSRIADFHPMSGIGITNGLILFQDLPKASLWEQLTQNYDQKGVLGIIASDMQGGIHAFQDAQISGGSASLPVVISLRDEDLMDQIDYNYEHKDKNAYVRLEAVASDTPIGAESPGNVQGYFGGEQQITRGLTVQSQDQLITWAGNLRAKINNKLPNVTAKLAGNYVIDAVPQHTLRMSMAASQNPRGILINNDLFLQKNTRLEFKSADQFMIATIEAEKSVNGIGGSAITFPKVTDIIPIPIQIPEPPPDPSGPTAGGGFGTVYVMTQDTLGRTRAFSATSPAWTSVGPSAALGLVLHDFILDPWSPSTTGYLTTDDGVFKSTTLDLASPVWVQLISAAQIEADTSLSAFRLPNKIVGSINQQNWVGFWFLIGPTATPYFKFGYSSDGGTTWTFVNVNSPTAFPGIENADSFGGQADIVPHLVSGGLVLYASIPRGGSSTTRSNYFYKSTNGGATWAQVSTLGTNIADIGWTIHCPYTGNESGNIVYFYGDNTSGTGMAYSDDSGATWTETTPVSGPNQILIHRWACETYTQSPQSYFWYYDGANHILYVSETPGGSFSAKGMNGISGLIYTSGGFPFNNSQFYAVGASGIFVSTDAGDNWVDKTGDWAFGFASTYSITRPKGGTVSPHAYVIVPDWTE